VSLFGGAGAAEPPMKFKACEPWSVTQKLGEERDAMGFYLSAHPLDVYGDALERLDVVPIDGIAAHLRNGGNATVKLAGTPGARKERIGKSGSRYAFLELSDASGTCEAMLFSEVLGASREILDMGKPLLVRADARLEGEEVRLLAQGIELLDNAVARSTSRVKIAFSESGPLARIQEIISNDGSGNRDITLVADLGDREVEIRLGGQFALRPETLALLRDLPGVGQVREV
jgi:DNA polymerase-3 subunit alpha